MTCSRCILFNVSAISVFSCESACIESSVCEGGIYGCVLSRFSLYNREGVGFISMAVAPMVVR